MLSQLLADGRRFSHEYGERLANHLPMALVALARLGATADRLRSFFAHYTRILRPKTHEETALIADIRRQLEERGLDAILPEYFRGVASGAFHGLIRLAYAIEARDEDETAEALASWKMDWIEMGPERSERSFMSAAQAFEAIRKDARFPAGKVAGPSIVARLGEVVANPAFHDYRPGIVDPSLEELAKIALAIYLATNDFTALHMVTACHATRVVQRWAGDEATSDLATALLAAYVTIGRPAFDYEVVDGRPTADWEAISTATLASNDDHVCKLVFSCREEQRHYGWPGYQVAAAAKAGLR